MRYGVILSSLIIFLIILIQAFLLGKVYRFEEKDFDRNVISAIKGLYDDLNLADKSVTRLNELISKLEEHVYLARVEKWLPEDSISFYTHKELLNLNISAHFPPGLSKRSSGNFYHHLQQGLLHSVQNE